MPQNIFESAFMTAVETLGVPFLLLALLVVVAVVSIRVK